MTSHTLCFDDGEEIVELVCHSLAHGYYVIKSMHLEGSRSRLEAVARLIRKKSKCKIYFSRTGHKFKFCSFGYTMPEPGKWVSKDTRHIAKPDLLWAAINQYPYCTPMLPAWEPALRLALQGAYLKKLVGLDPQGEYLEPSLTPAQLDTVVCGLVKRKVLQFS